MEGGGGCLALAFRREGGYQLSRFLVSQRDGEGRWRERVRVGRFLARARDGAGWFCERAARGRERGLGLDAKDDFCGEEGARGFSFLFPQKVSATGAWTGS